MFVQLSAEVRDSVLQVRCGIAIHELGHDAFSQGPCLLRRDLAGCIPFGERVIYFDLRCAGNLNIGVIMTQRYFDSYLLYFHVENRRWTTVMPFTSTRCSCHDNHDLNRTEYLLISCRVSLRY